MYIVVAVVVGLTVGLLAGGRLANLAERSFRAPGLLVAGLAIQVASSWAGSGGVALLLVSYGFLLAFAAANARHVGMMVVFVGISLNFLVIAANDGMPVRPSAIVAAGAARPEDVGSVTFNAKHHLETDADRLTFLADIVPVPLPGAREVVSYGDLVMAVGVADVIARWLRRRPERVAAEPRPARLP
ncbi:MAG TPA: DUF5317 domain-containing protein [Acidimicrobiales bacterium]|nr:DUF5317 domain-containing protein [Acidimicrobiales bacterium]